MRQDAHPEQLQAPEFILHSTLRQGQYWCDGKGRRRRIAELSLHEVLEAMSFLERQAELLHLAEQLALCCERRIGSGQHQVEGDARSHADPAEWLHVTPLYRALLAAIEGHLKREVMT